MISNKKMIIGLIISLSFFISTGFENQVECLSGENKIDLLIENKKNQDELEQEIARLAQEINSKTESINNTKKDENSEGIQVVTVSFVNDSSTDEEDKLSIENKIKEEISILEDTKSAVEKQLESYMIEGLKLEKNIEDDKQEYLKQNNLEYTECLWPLESYKTISSPFGDRIHPITGKNTFHKGIDIPAPQNTDILAADDGIVIFSGVQNGYGNVVKIKHFDGKETVYAHNTSNTVIEGDIVKRGQSIAKVGTTGRSTGNHVHFETIVNGKNINPINVATK